MQIKNNGEKKICAKRKLKSELQMKVVWNTCERELKSVNENYYQKIICKLPKANAF